MGNIEYNDDGPVLTGRTFRNKYDTSTLLAIPADLAKRLQIEYSKVS